MKADKHDERNTRQIRQSALHLAAAKNYLGLAYYMLENNLVTVDYQDSEQWTALHLAALHSRKCACICTTFTLTATFSYFHGSC